MCVEIQDSCARVKQVNQSCQHVVFQQHQLVQAVTLRCRFVHLKFPRWHNIKTVSPFAKHQNAVCSSYNAPSHTLLCKKLNTKTQFTWCQYPELNMKSEYFILLLQIFPLISCSLRSDTSMTTAMSRELYLSVCDLDMTSWLFFLLLTSFCLFFKIKHQVTIPCLYFPQYSQPLCCPGYQSVYRRQITICQRRNFPGKRWYREWTTYMISYGQAWRSVTGVSH